MRNIIEQGFPFDLQLFAYEGDDGAGGGGGGPSQVQQNQDPEFVEKKDPVTGKTVRIPKEYESIIGHFISSTRSDIEGKYKPIVEQLENEKANLNDVKAELDKLKEANMSAEEKAQANAKRIIDDAKVKETNALKEAATWKELFEKSTVKNDILFALGEYGSYRLCNTEQLAVLFDYEGKAKISEVLDQDGKPTGSFETRVALQLQDSKGEPVTVEGTPKELFPKWIALDRNAHHRKNELPSGGGSRTKTNQPGLNQDFDGMNPVEKMNAARGIKSNNK